MNVRQQKQQQQQQQQQQQRQQCVSSDGLKVAPESGLGMSKWDKLKIHQVALFRSESAWVWSPIWILEAEDHWPCSNLDWTRCQFAKRGLWHGGLR